MNTGSVRKLITKKEIAPGRVGANSLIQVGLNVLREQDKVKTDDPPSDPPDAPDAHKEEIDVLRQLWEVSIRVQIRNDQKKDEYRLMEKLAAAARANADWERSEANAARKRLAERRSNLEWERNWNDQREVRLRQLFPDWMANY